MTHRVMTSVTAAALTLGATWPAPARAGFTETLPSGVFALEFAYVRSDLDTRFDDDNRARPLIEPIDRYEPGGGLQGRIEARPVTNYHFLVSQLAYGITDELTAVVVVPLLLRSDIETNLSWTPGDYQTQLGRSYSEQDFWEWAASMGQPRPPDRWTGNKGALSDIFAGVRYALGPQLDVMRDAGLTAAATLSVVIARTARAPATEDLVTAGTTLFELQAAGDIGMHLSLEKRFPSFFEDRLALGVDVFYEVLLPRTYRTPRGTRNPLLLNQAPYVGDRYTIDGGDHLGASLQVDVVAWRGPVLSTFAAGGDADAAERLPPYLALWARYSYVHMFQSDWQSDSDLWEWEREELWRPGMKNILTFGLLASLLRLGVPVQLDLQYRNLTWIPGRNTRAPDVLRAGMRVLLKFWEAR
jgi:hypothetical protein